MPNLNEGQFEQGELFDVDDIPRQDPATYFHYSATPPNPEMRGKGFHGGTIDAAIDRSYSKVPRRDSSSGDRKKDRGYMTAFKAPPESEMATPIGEPTTDEMTTDLDHGISGLPQEARDIQERGGNVRYQNRFEDPGSTSIRLREFQKANVIATVPYTHSQTGGGDTPRTAEPYTHEGEARVGPTRTHEAVKKNEASIMAQKQGRLF